MSGPAADGAAAFSGTADLSFVAGFDAATQVAFVADESRGEGHLLVFNGSGFASWPGSGAFALAPQ